MFKLENRLKCTNFFLPRRLEWSSVLHSAFVCKINTDLSNNDCRSRLIPSRKPAPAKIRSTARSGDKHTEAVSNASGLGFPSTGPAADYPSSLGFLNPKRSFSAGLERLQFSGLDIEFLFRTDWYSSHLAHGSSGFVDCLCRTDEFSESFAKSSACDRSVQFRSLGLVPGQFGSAGDSLENSGASDSSEHAGERHLRRLRFFVRGRSTTESAVRWPSR